MNKLNKKILIIVGYGKEYGMGHWIRCTLLQQYLLKQFILVDLIKLTSFRRREIKDYHLVIFDIRDVSLATLSILKNENQTIMFLDSMAKKSSICHYWYTLPLADLSPTQNLLLLKNILIPQELLRKKNLITRKNYSKLHLPKNKEPSPIDFNLSKSRRGTQKKFIKKLSRSKSIKAYFGQTVFEAIFLRVANIYLEPITSYHLQLNKMLVRLYKSKSFHKNFDGQGLTRLIDKIKNILY